MILLVIGGQIKHMMDIKPQRILILLVLAIFIPSVATASSELLAKKRIEASKKYLISTYGEKCLYLDMMTHLSTYMSVDIHDTFFVSKCLMVFPTKEFGNEIDYKFALINIDVKNETYLVSTTSKGDPLFGSLLKTFHYSGQDIIIDKGKIKHTMMVLESRYAMRTRSDGVEIIEILIDKIGLTQSNGILKLDQFLDRIHKLFSINN